MARTRRVAAGIGPDPALRAACAGFAASVVRLATVDPVTTEVVRLRCAKYHDCAT